jgi:hypothetical protein
VSIGSESIVETTLDVTATFPAFSPYSAGEYVDRARLTISSINNTIPNLCSLVESIGFRVGSVVDIEEFATAPDDTAAANDLKSLLDQHGSDKATAHNYHLLYGHILKDRAKIRRILEVGLGSKNPEFVSNMGTGGKPGASVRAFRDFCPQARIYGADIDRGILFSEDRIDTFYVDQTDPKSFESLGSNVPGGMDMVVDDGLHSPEANLQTLQFGLVNLKIGGWVVVEDISPAAIPLWKCVSGIMPANYRCHILSARGGVLFAMKRLT